MIYPVLNTKSSYKSPIKGFYGINRKKKGSAGECVDCLNINGDEFPCLRSVPGNKDLELTDEDTKITKLLPPDEGDMRLVGLVDGDILGADGIKDNGFSDTRKYDVLKMNDGFVTLPNIHHYKKNEPYTIKRDLNELEYHKAEAVYRQVSKAGDGVYYFDILGKLTEALKTTRINKKVSWIYIGIESLGERIWSTDGDDYFIITSLQEVIFHNYNYAHGCIRVAYYKKDENGEFVQSAFKYFDDVIPYYNEDAEVKASFYIKTEYEDIPYGCIYGNRLWGVSGDGKEIICSKPGEPTELRDYNDGASSAWFTEVGSPGKFVGITSYNDAIFAFKENTVHVVYGTTPQNYSLEKTFDECGCIDGKSIITANNCLYWLGHNGIYKYSGGAPKVISEPLNKKYKKATAFTDNKKVYFNFTDENGLRELLCYDSEKGLWYSFSNPDDFLYNEDFLGGFLYDGKLYAYTSEEVFEIGGGEYGKWYFESVLEYNDTLNNTSAPAIEIRAQMKKGSSIKVEYKGVSQDKWEHCGTYEAKKDCMIKQRFTARLKNDAAYQYRLSGNGEVTIFDMEKTVVSIGRKII